MDEIDESYHDPYLQHVMDRGGQNPDPAAPELDTQGQEFLGMLDDFESMLAQDQRDSELIRRSLAIRDASFFGNDSDMTPLPDISPLPEMPSDELNAKPKA